MELQSQANVRNIAKQQAREQGLPVRHIIGEAERERRQPIDIDAPTIPSADGQDHWYGQTQRNPAAPTGLREGLGVSQEERDFNDIMASRQKKRNKFRMNIKTKFIF